MADLYEPTLHFRYVLDPPNATLTKWVGDEIERITKFEIDVEDRLIREILIGMGWTPPE